MYELKKTISTMQDIGLTSSLNLAEAPVKTVFLPILVSRK